MATLSQAASGDNILTSVGGRNKLFSCANVIGSHTDKSTVIPSHKIKIILAESRLLLYTTKKMFFPAWLG